MLIASGMFSKRDDGNCQMVQQHESVRQFVISHQPLTETIALIVRDLSRLLVGFLQRSFI